jgi:hypothetical protein
MFARRPERGAKACGRVPCECEGVEAGGGGADLFVEAVLLFFGLLLLDLAARLGRPVGLMWPFVLHVWARPKGIE